MNCNDCGGFLPRGCECSAFGGRREYWNDTPEAKAARMAVGVEPGKRECCNGECGWQGYTDRMVGAVGPLCPDCGEVTEPIGMTEVRRG